MEAKPSTRWRWLSAAAAAIVVSAIAYAFSGPALLVVQDKPESQKTSPTNRQAVVVPSPPAAPTGSVVPAAAAIEVEAQAARVTSNPPRRDQIRAAQSGLARLGFYGGRIDGSMGKGTIGAIRAFEKSLGWPATGQLTAKVAAQLTLQQGEASRR
jgi:hypothetical protein